MVFSSQIFLFAFLPVTLMIYYICRRRNLRNLWLILVSLFFYFYGSQKVVLLLMASVLMNWGMGLLIADASKKHLQTRARIWLGLSVLLNLSGLFYYKYFDFFIRTTNTIFKSNIPLQGIALPIGISFFTFQAMSYCIDVYRDQSLVRKNPLDIALYVAFFPQLIAGPIVRFSTIAEQIGNRHENWQQFSDGITRFVYGLAKKAVLANSMAIVVDDIWAMSADERSAAVAWIGSIAYTFQIFFDFSGYSDMAIGLGKMFGFEFLENFDHPYCSKSISEFWRRWHISLGSWFRDYVYIPLGGNRVKPVRLCFNLMIVWMLTGIWHGASYAFILWGLIYGILIILERMFKLEKSKIPIWIRRLYTLLTVNFLWVLFRAEHLSTALKYLKTMFGFTDAGWFDGKALFYLKENAVLFLFCVIVSVPLASWLSRQKKCAPIMNVLRPIVVCLLLIISVSYIVKGSYNPFIYFNF